MTRWSAYPEVQLSPSEPTDFERLAAELGLAQTPELWECSPQLMRFAERERHRRYVPENLLRTWALWVSEDEVNCTIG